MLFHRCQNAEIALQTLCVVIEDIILNHLYQGPSVRKASAVLVLTSEDAPKGFHRTVINALRHARHALYHSSLHQLGMERAVRILEASIAVEQRVSIRVR